MSSKLKIYKGDELVSTQPMEQTIDFIVRNYPLSLPDRNLLNGIRETITGASGMEEQVEHALALKIYDVLDRIDSTLRMEEEQPA